MALKLDGSVMQRTLFDFRAAFWKTSKYSSGEELAVVGGLGESRRRA
jgi:hypothetical protein